MRQALKVVWANPYVKVLVAVFGLVAAYLAFRATQPAGTLFLLAYALAHLANPLVDAMERRGARRPFGVALAAFLVVGVMWTVSQLSLNALSSTFTKGEEGVTLTESATEWFVELPQNLERLLSPTLFRALAGPFGTLNDLLERLGSLLEPQMESITTTMLGVVTGTLSSVFQAGVVLMLTVYLLHDYHRINQNLFAAVPWRYKDRALAVATTLDETIGAYVRGQLLVAAMVGVLVGVGLTIVGLPLAGFIGLLAGLLNIVPFLGSVAPAIPAVIIALAGGWWQVALVIAVFVIANQIDNHVLTPLILAKSTTLHPVTVVLGVIAGFAVAGFVGSIVAVPLIAFLKALYTDHLRHGPLYRPAEPATAHEVNSDEGAT